MPATSIAALQTVLQDASLPAEFVSNTATTFSTADSGLLSGYSIVILNKSDRVLSDGERVALEDFLAGGGVFIATGYDSLGSPTDAVLAGLLRITTTGDAFPDPACEVTDNNDLAFDGTYGTFPLGYTFTSLGSDFDGAGASATLGSRELIRMGTPAAPPSLSSLSQTASPAPPTTGTETPTTSTGPRPPPPPTCRPCS